MHTVIHANEGVPSDVRFTSAATNDSFMLKPTNFLLMVVQIRLKRRWNFSGLATIVRLTLMYYVNLYSLLNNPEKDRLNLLEKGSISPPELS